MQHQTTSRKYAYYLFITALLVALYLTTNINYLLFHSLVEIFSIVVAFSFFMISWNSRYYIKNQYVQFIGIAYLFIAFLDLMHTLSYKGMPIFTDYDYYANQLWIGARYLESLTLLTAFYFLGSEKLFEPEKIFFIYLLITIVLMLSIFTWKIFPICFIEGQGLTAFKKTSEYIICFILILSMILLYQNRAVFDSRIFNLLLLSILCTIVSELAFTFYISNYGFSNLVGHYFKLFSFYLIYTAIIETAIQNPYNVIFKELDAANLALSSEVKHRIKIEHQKETLIKDLTAALADVKTLSGLLPICAHCKKVRDDKGYWNQIEAYIEEKTDAEFSHGICRECAEKYFPEYKLYEDTE